MQVEEIYSLYQQYTSVQTDSRKIKAGDIYFALKGEHFNGNLFAKEAIQKGAVYAIIDEPVEEGESFILVHDVLHSLQELALHHRKQFSIPFIAITGSNGKTTTKELLVSVLSTQYKTYATKGNLNNHIGIPLTILSIPKEAEIAVIEMGANHQKEIEAYCQMVLPTHALITNCGKAHLEGFGGEEGVRKGKGELYDYMRNSQGVIFINNDLPYLKSMASGIQQQISYGSTNAEYIGKVLLEDNFLHVAILRSGDECLIKTNLIGDYNFANVMAAFTIGRYFLIATNKIVKAIASYMPDNSRSQLIKQDSNTIILDAYNANPSSMQVAITNFARADYPNKYILLGGMKELGDESTYEHQQVVNLLMQTNWNAVVLVGGNFKTTNHPYLYLETTEAAIEWFKQQSFVNAAILIKGSRAYTMEKIIQ